MSHVSKEKLPQEITFAAVATYGCINATGNFIMSDFITSVCS